MLLDLNKEIMNELGVTVVGDIIAILKHAKVVHRQVGALCHLSVPGFRVAGGGAVAELTGGLKAKAGRPGIQGWFCICCVTLGALPNLSEPLSICSAHIGKPILQGDCKYYIVKPSTV